ncbi:MAG: glycoside hydrolase family 127 protein, partial [Clostridia bacterium]|nr:glycoside hydrolase family 127 protein [Clostridia bacterium]
AGHLMEAAVAYYYATGKKRFLDLMCKYADYIEKRFKIDKDTDFVTPGHEEIELALVKMYHATGENRYLELSKFFVDERGKKSEFKYEWCKESYHQSHKPVREQEEAVGHAVRAVYLYSAMADLALKYGDKELKNACEKLFDDIVNHKMYITGGIGSSKAGEAFTIPYDLPNLIAYTESCAAIGLVFFAHRMLLLTGDVKYSHVIERILYNGFLSSFSLDGKSFFYCNPLEILPYLKKRDEELNEKTINMPITERVEVFECSCCPPNIVRFVPSIGNYLYTYDENAIYVHQFMESIAEVNGVTVEQKTSYPYDGKIQITVKGKNTRLCVRIPEYIDTYEGENKNGYAIFDVKDGETVTLDFEMKPQLYEANPLVTFDSGKVALMRGPVVYCLEEVDNGKNIRDIRIDKNTAFNEIIDTSLNALCIEADAYRRKPTISLYAKVSEERIKIKAKFIPYYAFANRGESEMTVWFLAE